MWALFGENVYAKTKELGPIGGVCRARPLDLPMLYINIHIPIVIPIGLHIANRLLIFEVNLLQVHSGIIAKRTSGYFFLLVTRHDSMITPIFICHHESTKSHNVRLEMLRVDAIFPVSCGFNFER